MKAIAIVVISAVLGGLFINEKMEAPHETEGKTEIVYGHRIGPNGVPMLVTSN